MQEIRARIELVLDSSLPTLDGDLTGLHEAMRYALVGGGKYVRPLLCFAAGEVTQACPAALDRVACALEMVHVYSLVHDDLPCMDNDTLRRGKPTVHVQFDEGTALLVGDALQTQAFSLLSETSSVLTASQSLALVHELAHAAGSFGMVGGQAIDLASVGQRLPQNVLEAMHRMKTGALLRASLRMGALCGDPLSDEAREMLDVYASAVGLLFQVVDDILDCTENSNTLGKTAGKDAKYAKPTYVSLLGLDATRALTKQLHADAYKATERLGKRANRLRALANFVVQRIH
ncbi:polyprenyl synthetase family protein [Candidatus Pandoraea novymonadis]|nr:farnesyl diphosphate synthase [Candidatus Pandoraea novymonadis]